MANRLLLSAAFLITCCLSTGCAGSTTYYGTSYAQPAPAQQVYVYHHTAQPQPVYVYHQQPQPYPQSRPHPQPRPYPQ
ncbi:MAG: hypothetical protein KC457_33485, partial [Myxococcales bacterium]|nr:hypothetical protein [Myxococcales bacterium]